MKEFLRYIDFISKEENLRIDKNSRYKNILGGIISFLISTFSVIITIFFFSEMFSSQDPRVISSKGSDNQINNYTLSKDEIQFFVSLEYSNSTYYVDETVYTVSGKFTEINFIELEGKTSQHFVTKEIQLIRCKDIYDKEDKEKYNLKLPIQYFYCINPEDKTQIGGSWGSKYFSKVEIFVNKCRNETISAKTNKPPCKPQKEINKIIDHGIVSMYATTYYYIVSYTATY